MAMVGQNSLITGYDETPENLSKNASLLFDFQ